MKLADIEPGITYALRDSPTDKNRRVFGEDLGKRATVSQFLGYNGESAEVLEVGVPYKKGNQGVRIRGIKRPRKWCRCPMCGQEHPTDEKLDTEVEFVVHASALISIGEEIERELRVQGWILAREEGRLTEWLDAEQERLE